MSEQVQVRITGLVVTSRYGTLSTGTILRTDAAFAKHLVEECHGAEYLDAPPVTQLSAPAVESTEEQPAESTQPDTPQE